MSKNIAKNLSEQELRKMLDDLKAKLMQLSFDLADKKLKDTSQIGKAKKEIARILTELKLKKI
ncbi:MAG: 50S ribosomal protein L29 [Parcubacteria group bacterium GW2011_GWC1_39_29]|uniref:Large ribosomal subunit protein uL29 n=1 Tax=Candidatus Yanofskybacteria bacterium GW2011_GWD1_39_16 TaxID=1619030 RepID=A0A837HPE1_9BACT|nr:MAG: 50S ribosomal protein L29 [Candidatus Yanofskybacteria bacterium GW2011_GWD1_39_16]KKR14161.1 MAG: 50S ribosomal protein L29 [Parcubacteria group bacterium GW2011_GWC1_39_29]